jgi:3-hydroxyisobutyrate dehydrogenase
MARIGFIGLGHMGGPMAANLAKAGHQISAFDVVPAAREKAASGGITVAASALATAAWCEVLITMLPAGAEVRSVLTGADDLLGSLAPDTLLIDCSTIDVETARALEQTAASRGLAMLDAPVSGGVAGAQAATLTFMVGGAKAAFARAEPILKAMGKAVIHAGPAGNGQVAKICNNLILGITMIGVSEALALGSRLGLNAETLHAISSKSSGACWALNEYCPAPGPVPKAPSNRDYQPGFTAAMMLKDLRLAQTAAQQAEASSPLGAVAAALYALYCNSGQSGRDFSGIFQMIEGKV